jgi:hypothetical protein
MTAVDGDFDETIEEVQAELDIQNLSSGRHTIFIQGQDTDGNWGPFWATWLTVIQARISGSVIDDQTGELIDAANLTLFNPSWTYTTQTDASGNFALEVISGTYAITATSTGYYSATIENVVAQSGLTTSLLIRLTPQADDSGQIYLPLIIKDR